MRFASTCCQIWVRLVCGGGEELEGEEGVGWVEVAGCDVVCCVFAPFSCCLGVSVFWEAGGWEGGFWGTVGGVCCTEGVVGV